MVDGAGEMAAAMGAAAEEPDRYAKERVEWAGERTWARRTDAWLDAALGRRRMHGIGTTRISADRVS